MAAHRAGWIGCAATGLLLSVMAAMLTSIPAAAGVPKTVHLEIESLIEDLSFLYGRAALAHAGFTVEESGTGYRVTLNGVRLMANSGRHLALGAVVLLLEPDDAGYRIKGIEIPRSFPMKSVNGGYAGQVTVGEYALTGLWQRTASAIVQSELHLDDIQFNSWPEEMTLREVKTVTRLSPAGNGLWQEAVDVAVSEFRQTWQRAVSGYVSGAELHLRSGGIDLDRYEMLQRLLDKAEAEEIVQGRVDPALLAELRQAKNITGAFQVAVALRDLLVDGDEDQPIVVPKAELSLSAEGLDGEAARAILHLTVGGADVPVTEHHGGGLQYALGPQSLDLNIAVEALPWPALWEAIIDFAFGGSVADQDEATWRLGLALQDAGTRLRLLPSHVASKTTTVRGDGEISGDPAAALGVVASLAFEIEGLLIAKGTVVGSPGREALAALLELEELGQPVPGPNGMPNYRYDVGLGADGTLTVNGKPFSLLEGMEQ